MNPLIHLRRACVVLATSALVVTTVATSATAAPKQPKAQDPTKLATKLVKQVTAAGANRHLIALQRIADRNGGTRAVLTPGYDASVDYVAGKLQALGFIVETPTFTYLEDQPGTLTVAGTTIRADRLQFSVETPAGGLTAPIVSLGAPEDTTPGCEAADFAGTAVSGSIALIRRGSCTFALKSQNAQAAGAVGVLIANNVEGPLTSVTLGDGSGVTVPVAGISQADGVSLDAQSGVSGTLDLTLVQIERSVRNILAQTRTGRTDNVVMAGAHLDSVPAGPGINDNGTGSASLLELATRLGSSPKVTNAVRFAWWGAEELGLLGSDAYVAGLTFEQQLDISMYLNFDMVGSPNAGYFVYDGDDSDAEGSGAGPYGSAQIEATFTGFLNDQAGIPTEGTDFDGRSDYGPFIAVGIPSGGLFTGAEGIKTEDQAAKWGGQAGVAYDPCYHQACDNLGNVDRAVLDENLDAIAWAVGIYGTSTEAVNGVPSRAERASARAASKAAAAASEPAAEDQAA